MAIEARMNFSAVGQCAGGADAGRLLVDLYCPQADVHQGPQRVETRSTRRPFRVANKDDAFGCVGIKISPEIVGVKKKEHAPAGLIADAGNLLFADCTGEEDLTGIVTLRGDDDPSRDCESYSGNAQ
jgi:hypothetical protein